MLSGAVMAAIASPSRDSGPPGAVAAIRHDLPILLADELNEWVNQKPIVDMVIADGHEAVATWRTRYLGNGEQLRGLVVLRFISGRWWWRAAAATADAKGGDSWSPMKSPGEMVGFCGRGFPAPSAHDLLAQGFVSSSFAKQLRTKLKPAPAPAEYLISQCDAFGGGDVEDVSTAEGYYALFLHKEVNETGLVLDGGSPKNGASTSAQDQTPLYTFTLSTTKRISVPFRAGSTLTVWFPYVLKGMVTYTLTLNGVNPEMQTLPGRLKNNVLSFTLSAFSILAGVPARGEIMEVTKPRNLSP